MIESAPIVGAHFRPPAKAILQALPHGCGLVLEREKDNAFDSNAVKVIILQEVLESLPKDNLEFLACSVTGFGSSLEEILAQDWQLGYVASKTGEAAHVAGLLDSGRNASATLDFTGDGKPLVRLAWR